MNKTDMVLVMVISNTDPGSHAVHKFSGSRHTLIEITLTYRLQSSDSADWAYTLMVHPTGIILYLKNVVLFSNLMKHNLYYDDSP